MTTRRHDHDDAYLLDRERAAARYGISLRRLDQIYRQYPDFPIIRNGRAVLVHRRLADEWFDARVGDRIDIDEE